MLFLRHFWYHFIWYKSKPIQKDKTQRVYETLDNDWNLPSLPMTHSSRVCSAVVFCTGLNSSYPSPPIPAHFTSIPTHSPHRPSPSQSHPNPVPAKYVPTPHIPIKSVPIPTLSPQKLTLHKVSTFDIHDYIVLHYQKPLQWLVCKARSLPSHSRSNSTLHHQEMQLVSLINKY